MFDQLFFNVFNYYKDKKYKKANTIAIVYITLLHSALLLFLGVFFSEFFKQMRLTTLTNNEVWLIYFLGIIGLYFMNWIQYSGRKRNIRRANLSKNKSEHRSIVILWLIPILCILLSIIFLKLV